MQNKGFGRRKTLTSLKKKNLCTQRKSASKFIILTQVATLQEISHVCL